MPTIPVIIKKFYHTHRNSVYPVLHMTKNHKCYSLLQSVTLFCG